MRFTMTSMTFCAVTCAAIVALPAMTRAASAEGAFVDQAVQGATSGRHMSSTMPAMQPSSTTWTPHSAPAMTPETAAAANAAVATGGNIATTLEIGKYNRVFQGQAGSGNVSNVGILAGIDNNVGVLQGGHGLVSNLLLVNTAGLSIGVIQPNGSAPVNMLIARLPNGGLLIKR